MENYDIQVVALMILGVLLLAVIVGIAAIITFYVKTKGELNISKNLKILMHSKYLVELATVSLLVFTIIFLAIINKLGDGVLALLGTMAGYVLGNAQKNPKDIPDPVDNTEKQKLGQ